jgi:hypothetical protein
MSLDLVEFNHNVDLTELQNEYPASDIQMNYINDNNNGNYANGYVNFTSASIVGITAEKQFQWSQGYLAIPYLVTLTPVACTLSTATATAPAVENAYAVGTKGYHNFVDSMSCKFNGVSINRNTSNMNFLINEKLKMMNED